MPANFIQRLKQLWFTLASNVWFAYATIILLQTKVMWNIWRFKDLTNGDTSAYFVDAFHWNNVGLTRFSYTPIYTAYYGTLLKFFPDAVTVTWIHRVIIVFVLAILVLMLMRRLLPPGYAWLIAAWWVILPINFDSLYEVHLFAAIPALVACIIASKKPSVWTRGVALGIFALGAVLIRNELTIATGLWLLICFIAEVKLIRSGARKSIKTYIAAYILPLALGAVVVTFFYIHSNEQGSVLQKGFEVKHTLNVCQIYAFSYYQRYTDWRLSPWTQCQDLMKRDFGTEQPSMTEAIRINPPAMLSYFMWNVRLIPYGLQVLLFNGTAGNLNPDYVSVNMGFAHALWGSVLFVGVAISGFILAWRGRLRWWSEWFAERYLGWLAMLCTVVTVAVVMLMQRPRPSYMFNLSFFLMATFGMCTFVILKRLNKAEWVNLAMPILAIVLIVLIPHYYQEPNPGQISLTEEYNDTKPFARLMKGNNILVANFGLEFCHYVAYDECQTATYGDFKNNNPQNLSLPAWLDQNQINVIYVDKTIYADFQQYLTEIDPEQWKTAVNYQTPTKQWMLLTRSDNS